MKIFTSNKKEIQFSLINLKNSRQELFLMQ